MYFFIDGLLYFFSEPRITEELIREMSQVTINPKIIYAIDY